MDNVLIVIIISANNAAMGNHTVVNLLRELR